ncbi:glycosyltransferase [Verrucomicrobiota bacterium]
MKLLYLHDVPLDMARANVLQVLHMCSAFAGHGQDVTLAVPRMRGAAARCCFGESIISKPATFEVVQYPCLNVPRFKMAAAWLGARRLVRATEADWCMTRSPLLLDLAIRAGHDCVYEAHNSFIHKSRVIDGPLTRQLLMNCRSRSVLCFVAISGALAGKWRDKGVPSDKVIALHDAVDADGVQKTSDGNSVREELGIKENAKVVVYAGSLYPDREIGRVFGLAEHFRDAVFLLVGGPRAAAEECRRVGEERGIDNIIVHDRVPHSDVPSFLACADVLLMIWSKLVPTMNYCSPLKLFEYMASGRIIVGDGYPTIREVLTDGQEALLAEPDNVGDLKLRLSEALEMSYPNEMASAARDLALSKHTWQGRAEAILARVRQGK